MATFSQAMFFADNSASVLHSFGPDAAQEFNLRSSNREDEEDGEIGVFGAEKYFNDDGEDCSSTKMSVSLPSAEDSLMDIPKLKVSIGTFSGLTDSCSSSQNALVGRETKPRSRKRSGKVKQRNFLATFCRCACSDKCSVEVREDSNHGAPKAPAGIGSVEQIKGSARMPFRFCHSLKQPSFDVERWMRERNHKIRYTYGINRVGEMNKESCLSFADLSSVRTLEEDKPWKSLGVFGDSCSENRRKQSLATIPSEFLAPQPFGQTIVSNSSGICCNKDYDSDGSSDLIEIESLSGKVISYFGAQNSGIVSGCRSPATYYEPSEGSIDWSVVTASAVNMSVMSEHDENNIGSPPELCNNVRKMSWSEWNRQFSSRSMPITAPPQSFSSEVSVCDNPDNQSRRFSTLQVPMFSTFNRLKSAYQLDGGDAFATVSLSPRFPDSGRLTMTRHQFP